MRARVYIRYTQYERGGAISGYMVKDSRLDPDWYRFYDHEGTFRYGVRRGEPWTVFRLYDGERLVYVGRTQSKHLQERVEGYSGRWTRVATEEFQNRQQAEDAERFRVREMGFKKWNLGRRGKMKWDYRRQEIGQRRRTVEVQRRASQDYINKMRIARAGQYLRCRGDHDHWINAAKGIEFVPRRADPKLRDASPGHRLKTVKRGEDAISDAEDLFRKATALPLQPYGVYQNTDTHCLGTWNQLKRPVIPRVALEGKLEGLDEILTEVDGGRYVPEIAGILEKRLQFDDAFRDEWNQVYAEAVADALSDPAPALPVLQMPHKASVAKGYVERVMQPGGALEQEQRLSAGMQLSNLLRRMRHKGTLETHPDDRLSGKSQKKALISQARAAGLLGVHNLTINNLENIWSTGKAPTEETLIKVFCGLETLQAETLSMGDTETKLTPERRDWIISVAAGREIIRPRMGVLYRERVNPQTNYVHREGVLRAVASRRIGSWDDLTQAAFLKLWEDAGHKDQSTGDGRRKDDPVQYDIFARVSSDTSAPMRLILEGDNDPTFAEWAKRRANSAASSERRREYKKGERERSRGEGWQLEKTTAKQKEEENARYLHYVTNWPVVGTATLEQLARIGETQALHKLRRALVDFKELGQYPAAASFPGMPIVDPVIIPTRMLLRWHRHVAHPHSRVLLEVIDQTAPDLQKLHEAPRLDEPVIQEDNRRSQAKL